MNPWLAPLLFATSLLGQPPKVRLPDEAAGVDGIARTLISAFDQVDIVALGEAHGQKLDSDLRIAFSIQSRPIRSNRHTDVRNRYTKQRYAP